jgi:hypothetical protein
VRLVLEGLTGTGKSSTIAALGRLGLAPACVVSEEETLGDAMDELPPDGRVGPSFTRRLEAVIARLERERPPAFLLERGHLSYVALVPRWELVDAFDARLGDLGARLALLVVPDQALAARSLLREEYGGADFQAFAERFGSVAAALEALRVSQARRVDALARTRLPHRTFDTSSKDWDRVARDVAAWAAAG